MNKSEIVTAIKARKKVKVYGDLVVADGIDYSWQEPELWVKLSNGARYKASDKDIRNMSISET